MRRINRKTGLTRNLALATTAVLALALTGCGDDDEMMSPEMVGTAMVRVAHLSPDAPNVDVWVDGAVVAALVDVPFQAVSGYLALDAGDHNIQVFATGATTGPVIDADVTLTADASYTVAATGLLADLTPLVLVDDSVPAPVANAHVRFVHLSPDAPSVDVRVASGPTLFADTIFRGSKDYLPVDPGTYDLEVLINSDQSLALSVPGLALSGGTNYTVFAIGLAGDATLAALPVVDAP